MHKIERIVGPGPLGVAVVEFELYVGWDPRRLNRGNVGTDYFGARVFVGKVAGKK